MVKNLPAMQKTRVQSELGKSPREGNSYPLQYFCLEKSMDRGAWGGYCPWGHKKLDMTKHSTEHLYP